MSIKQAKPFLKWAGGKTQLLETISSNISYGYDDKFFYIEPFIGGGAVLFSVLNNYKNLEKAIINDINLDLINSYRTIKYNVENLVDILNKWQTEYHDLVENEELKKKYFYTKRDLFNQRNSSNIIQAALLIFLNRTCFNGLYRVNKKNQFNVPMGSYKKPMICDRDNLLVVSKLLQKVEILHGDFEKTLDRVPTNSYSLFYFDPPYKPLSKTANFNSYANNNFNDDEQIRLKQFCDKLDKLNYSWILSNSDVKTGNDEDNFFDQLYSKYYINRVLARRSINSNASQRGKLNELLITNIDIENNSKISV